MGEAVSARGDYIFLASYAERNFGYSLAAVDAFAALDRIDELEAQLERIRAEYAAAITRIAEPQLTVEACDRILAAIRQEGL